MTEILIAEVLELPDDAPPIMRELYEDRCREWQDAQVAEFRAKLDEINERHEIVQIRPTSLWQRLVERLKQ